MELSRHWEKVDIVGDVFAARTGHTMVSDNAFIWLFGGTDGVTRKNDIFRFDIVSGLWQGIVPEGSPPSPRSGSQAVIIDSIIYFFGGYTKKNGDYFNDLYAFNTLKSEWSCIQFQPSDYVPSKRTDHTLCSYKSLFYLFAGYNGSTRFNDVQVYNAEEKTWKEINTNNPPETRFGHTAATYKDKMIIFGGWNGHNTLNDMWTFSYTTKQWNKLVSTGYVYPRYRHSAVIYGSSMFIFGGVNKEQLRFDDLVEFNIHESHYKKLTAQGACPSARTFHKACMVDNCMYIVGGFDGIRKNDVYRINLQEDSPEDDLETNPLAVTKDVEEDLLCWKEIKFTGKTYSARTGHTSVQIGCKIYVFGGTDETTRRNDLHCYDMMSNCWSQVETQGMVPTPRSGAKGVACGNSFYLFGGYTRKDGVYYNDLYRFDTASGVWTKLFCTGEAPSIRTDHTAVLYENAIYIFGGYDGKTRFNDLKACKLENFEWVALPEVGVQPLPRFGHTAVVYNHSMYVFGGWDGHETLEDLYQYSFTTNIWYELRRTLGIKPSPRYRHSCVVFNGSLFIFGGVDKSQKRFNDLHEFNIQHKEWSFKNTGGEIPSQRTFHTALAHENCMFILGGFDGKRQNDLYVIKLLCEDSDIFSRTSSSISSLYDLEDNYSGDALCQELTKQNFILKQQEKELRKRLEVEKKRNFCKSCGEKPINTVLLECAHFVLCESCAKSLKNCFVCKKDILKIVVTYTSL